MSNVRVQTNINFKMEDEIMTTTKENAKKEKETKTPKTWLAGYVKGREKSAASLITHLMMSGANEKQLVESAIAFNNKQGKGAKCLTTKGSLRQHCKWLETKGLKVAIEKNNYKLAA